MMTLIWLRVALVCYAAGLLYALVALTRTSEILSKIALHASYLGMVFHFVSLTEAVVQSGQLASASGQNSESLLAFLVMVGFMLAYLVYKTTTPGIVIFPLVFLLTFVAATGQQPLVFGSAAMKHGWLAVHILMIFIGYAALFLSFGASILYLLQERALKSKSSSGMFARLPALQVIDDIGYRSLMLGFPFMTTAQIATYLPDRLHVPTCLDISHSDKMRPGRKLQKHNVVWHAAFRPESLARPMIRSYRRDRMRTRGMICGR